MQFPCARCGRTYEIADELVVGRAVRVACPACGNLVVHRVPAAEAAVAAQPAPPLAPALWEADDDDFENAWSALEAPPAAESPGPAARAPAPPARASAPAPAPAKPPATRAPAKPAVRRPPPPTTLPDDENVPTVTAELVLIRRSARRSRLTAAAIALGALGALVGVGTMGLKWKRQAPVAGAARGGAGSSVEGAAGGALSAADIAKLMGRPEPEPPPEGRARAPAPAPRAADRPKHEKLAVGDKGLLDLLGRKGDVAVTVQDDDAGALATTRGSLDEASIEGTLSRNSSSFAACVSRAASTAADQRLAANRVNLELTIRPSGRVQKAAVADKAVAGTPLGQCIAQAAKRMVFPGFDGEPLDIVVPLKLRVGL
ncbi:MAG TPA: AgmX/PglI C-terminal domain-containing protein [Anaeromyxobacteraceae bacterium]|nr:AgmX/PglI C-terminal domain-containing protein [Anaeromyxobacteraceae bacterium]